MKPKRLYNTFTGEVSYVAHPPPKAHLTPDMFWCGVSHNVIATAFYFVPSYFVPSEGAYFARCGLHTRDVGGLGTGVIRMTPGSRIYGRKRDVDNGDYCSYYREES